LFGTSGGKCFEFVHPTQASRVRLRVFPEPGGYLVIEERLGTVSVRNTLGLLDTQESAAERLRARETELLAQRYQRVDA
jgi:hypothetical protein